MWQPNRAQWSFIWTAAVLLILAWPPGDARSLGVKTINWAVDPGDSLPTLPEPLPMGLDDNGDAVAAHDAQEAEYHRLHEGSALTRWRMNVKTARDPFDPSTEREILAGVGILGALGAWRVAGRQDGRPGPGI